MNRRNEMKFGNNNDNIKLHDVNVDKLVSVGAIRLPPTVGNATFHAIGTMF